MSNIRPRLTETDFNTIVLARGIKETPTLEGSRLVMLDGLTYFAAAKIMGIDVMNIHRQVKTIRDTVLCKCCGQAIKPR